MTWLARPANPADPPRAPSSSWRGSPTRPRRMRSRNSFVGLRADHPAGVPRGRRLSPHQETDLMTVEEIEAALSPAERKHREEKREAARAYEADRLRRLAEENERIRQERERLERNLAERREQDRRRE